MFTFKAGVAAFVSTFFFSTALAQDLATDGLQARIDHLSKETGSHEFEIGALQALRAVEKSLQARYAYGLGNRLTRLPLFRLSLEMQHNPAPVAAAPDTFSSIIETFQADVNAARQTLSAAQPPQPFVLTLEDIWFDINGNGMRDTGEAAADALLPVVLDHRSLRSYQSAQQDAPGVTVRFDESDHAWLLAYTHMLSGLTHAYLAFDPTPVIRDLTEKRAALTKAAAQPDIQLATELRATLGQLDAAEIALLQRREDLERRSADRRQAVAELQAKIDKGPYKEVRKETKARDKELTLLGKELAIEKVNIAREFGEIKKQRRQIRGKLGQLNAYQSPPNRYQSTFDLAYIIIQSLRQQPDKDRIQSMRQDWALMLDHNRHFWRLVSSETDDDREWIPNPNQTSALKLRVSEDMVKTWQSLLEDAEQVLNGDKLIPHSLLPQGTGINLAAWLDAPSPINLVDWIHGIGAYPYAEPGPVISNRNWRAFQRLTQGRAGSFAILFN